MGFVLVPARGDDLFVNTWQWHPTVELLRVHELVGPDKAELMHRQTTFVAIGDHEAVAFADFLDEFVRGLGPDSRLLLDLSVTDEPDTYEFYRDDLAKNYSATKVWLERFAGFCRACGGFNVA